MAGGEAQAAGSPGTAATQAEIEALCAVMAATIDMAEAARSEAAAALLRRALALALAHDRCASAGGGRDAFSPS